MGSSVIAVSGHKENVYVLLQITNKNVISLWQDSHRKSWMSFALTKRVTALWVFMFCFVK